jgi:hypothetical protein
VYETYKSGSIRALNSMYASSMLPTGDSDEETSSQHDSKNRPGKPWVLTCSSPSND